MFSSELVTALKGVIEGGTKAAPLALKVIANLTVHPHHHHLIQDTGNVSPTSHQPHVH